MDQETFDIIEKISIEHSNKVFGYLEKEDLRGEIWQICLDKINDFDNSKGELEHWLRVIVKNRLVNRFKDITKSVRSPCPRCEFYDKGKSPSDCAKFGDDRYLCSKWRNYQLSIESRNSLLNASEPQMERHSAENPLNKIVGGELIDLIWAKIDKSYHRDLQEFMSNGKISKQRMKKLRAEIIRISSIKDIKDNKNNQQNLVKLMIKGKDAHKNTQ